MDRPSVTVVTATTGHPRLRRCLASVQDQSYPRVEHLVVVDGPEHLERAETALAAADAHRHPARVLALPWATGAGGFGGHRIYGASTYLVGGDFVAFLDEDNWFDPDHVESLVAAICAADADWGFALRKIVDEDGAFITHDRCDSHGDLHPVLDDDRQHLVDTSCHLLRTDLAVRLSPLWYRRRQSPDGPPRVAQAARSGADLA